LPLLKTRLFQPLRWGAFVAAAGVGLGACDEKLSDITGPTPNLEPTLSSIQREIFTPRCASCHTGGGRFLPAAQNLTDGNAYAALVGVPSIGRPAETRVVPGDSDSSYLIKKLEGVGTAGARMPFNGTPLTDGQILVIRRWIEIGAPNN
jgi:hypothetical protein